jgi:hypothetical protein
MTLEILDFPFVLFRCLSGFKSSEIPAFPGFRIGFAGIKSVFPGFQFTYHAVFGRDNQISFPDYLI